MHAANASTSGSSGDSGTAQNKKSRRPSRSHSFSSASIVTVKRPGSRSSTGAGSRNSAVPRPQSPVESRITTRPSRESKPVEHQRRKSIAVDGFEQNGEDASGGLDRWSQSTSSSAASSSHTRRNRSSSGAVLSNAIGQPLAPRHRPRTSVEHSTRSSPQKISASRTNSLRQAPSPTTSLKHSRRPSHADALAHTPSSLPSLYAAPSLTDSNDVGPPSTAQTIPTPSTQSPAYARTEYLGSETDTSAHGSSKAKHRMLTHDTAAPGSINYTQTQGQEGQSVGSDRHDNSHRRTRTKDRTDRDKKTMLSRALEKANTAVLLDNAANIEGALDAYSDACALLLQVMERTSGEDDRRKLGAISETYSHRIVELSLLIQGNPNVPEEKDLPERPMSGRSTSPVDGFMPLTLSASPSRPSAPPSASTDRPTASRISFAPRLSYHKGDRDSFFSKTMAAVQDSMMDQDDFLGNRTMFDRTIVSGATGDEPRTLKRTSVHLPPPDHAQYMPRPLSPRRPQSPQLQPQVEDAWLADPEQLSSVSEPHSPTRANSHESITWLDTIDESRSSRTSSVHSLSSHDGLRRKHIRGVSGDTDAEFDAAFDAAVEAAYNEGYEPDLESREQPTPAPQHRPKQASIAHSSDIREGFNPQPFQMSNDSTTELSDEEEERLLDEITQDFASGLGFSFDTQTKTAPPRQSDSSGYSRSTWQSSQLSDRATAATSLSTVAEDGLTAHATSKLIATPSSASTVRAEAPSMPLPPAPTKPTLARPPSSSMSTVRNRRLSGQNPKQLKIETAVKSDGRKRASTFHHSGSPFAEVDETPMLPLNDRETKSSGPSAQASSGAQNDLTFQSLPTLELHSIPDDIGRPVTASAATEYRRPSYEEFPGELQTSRPTLFRKNKSSASLREHTGHTLLLASPDLDSHPTLITPMSSTFATFIAKRNQNPLTSQRANFPPFGQAAVDGPNASGVYLFDTSLTAKQGSTSPKPQNLSQPATLEPCPESLLLRPFWLMRTLSNTLVHPRGGFLTNKLFVPREVWQTRGVKLKLVEDKIANCDLLTAALGRLASVDSYDVEAIMDELQSFEEVVERVQATLGKRLGSDVGIHGTASFFKDAAVSSPSDASPAGTSVDKATKSNSGKSYLSSWRKLRNKSSGTPLSSTGSSVNLSRQQSATSVIDKDHPHSNHSMPSVPMTSFVPVERRGQKRDTRNLVFEGPHKEYMGSLARLFDSVHVLDQIARQVEDPGLKHSSPTHVGLELSTRHAAEFFAFYICRFVLTDLGVLLEKFLKKGTEWVLA